MTPETVSKFFAYGIVIVIAGGILAGLAMLVLWLLSGLWSILF